MLSHKLRRYRAAAAQATDANFKQTTLLLHGDGTNGGQNNTFIGSNYASANLPGGFGASFDGSGDYLTCSPSAFALGTGDFTVEMWIYWTALPSSDVAFIGGVGTGAGSSIGIYNFGSNIYLIKNNNAASIAFGSKNQLAVNQWNHLAITRSGNTHRCFINGVLDTAGAVTSTADWATPNGATYIGSQAGTQNYLNGYLSNVRVVLGTALYTSNFTPPTAPLTAVTNTSLLTCHASTFIDGSTNNFTITANGNAAVATRSTFELTVTRNGNTTQGTFSPFSVGASEWSNFFDGTGDFLVSGSNSALTLGTGDFTIECWYYRAAANAGSYNGLLGIGTEGTGNISLFVNFPGFANKLYVNFFGYSGYGTTGTIDAGKWYHIAVTRVSGTIYMYLDGVQVGTASANHNLTGTTAVVGRTYPTSDKEYINGYVSNFRVVKGTAVYTAAFTPPTAPLTAITNTSLLTCQSNRFRDASSTNLTITRNGDVTVRPFSPFAPTAAYSASTNGGSGYFDGTGDFLSYSGTTFNGDFCAECWFYRTANPTNYSVIFGGSGLSGANNHQFIVRNNNSVELVLAGNVIIASAGTAALPNQWNHIAWVRSGSNCAIFVNGVRQGTATSSDNTSICSRIGDIAGLTGYLPIGYISDARIVIGSSVYDPTITTLTVPTAPLTAITNTNLLLKFTNAAIIDNTGKNVLETASNAQISTSVVKFGTGSIYLDGNGSSHLSAAASPDFVLGTGDFTIEAWTYRTSATDSLVIATTAGATTGFTLYIPTTGQLQAYLAGGGIYQGSTATVSLNQWVHVAMTRQGTSLRFFINGTLLGTVTSSDNVTSTGPFYVGRFRGGAIPAQAGYIDDLRITKGIARYTANFTPPTAPFEDR